MTKPPDHRSTDMRNSGADGTRSRNQRRIFGSCPPMGTMAANWRNGDFGTSPFFGQLVEQPVPYTDMDRMDRFVKGFLSKKMSRMTNRVGRKVRSGSQRRSLLPVQLQTAIRNSRADRQARPVTTRGWVTVNWSVCLASLKGTHAGYSLNSNLSATFPARWASVMDAKKASECSIGLVLPAR